MFLSGMLGGLKGEELHLRLEHAQMRPLPLQEKSEGRKFLLNGPADSSAG